MNKKVLIIPRNESTDDEGGQAQGQHKMLTMRCQKLTCCEKTNNARRANLSSARALYR